MGPAYALRFVVDSSGSVDSRTVELSPNPGSYALENFRRELWPVRFHPGEHRGRPVRTEVLVPIRLVEGRLTPDLAAASWNPGMEDRSPRAAQSGGRPAVDASDAEVKPQLLNANEVQVLLQELYPPLLRDAGVTGQTSLQFVIDAEGGVVGTSIVVTTATHEAFAEASAAVVARMRFSPAIVDGEVVPVLMDLPIAWTLERS